MKITCLRPGKANLFTSPSNDEKVLEEVFETYTDMIILIRIYTFNSCTLIQILRLTSTSVDVFISCLWHFCQANRTCLCFSLFFMPLMLMRTVFMIWLLYGNLWLLYKCFYTCDMHMMHVYAHSAQFFCMGFIHHGFYNEVYIHLWMYTCFVFYCFINTSVFVSHEELKLCNQSSILRRWLCVG